MKEQSHQLSAVSQQPATFIVTYRGFPLFFEDDPYRQCFRIVAVDTATKFTTRQAALMTAREYHADKPPFAIEPLNS